MIYLEYVLENGYKLMDLINNSLNLNRLDFYNNVHKEFINLKEYVDKNLEVWKSNKKYSNITLNIDVDENIFIYTDKKLFDNLIGNLISNSFKHNKTTEGLKHQFVNIFISKNADSEEFTDKLLLTIENTGNFNIKKNHIFKPFSKNNNSDGHGLGLSIIKKIVDILEEELNIEEINTNLTNSNQNNNIIYMDNYRASDTSTNTTASNISSSYTDNNICTTVRFTISFSYKRDNKLKLTESSSKIVYLEDNKFNQLLMKNIMKKVDLTIKDNAHNLLDYIQKFDILLLDMFLNDINGPDVIELLKKENIIIPIIAVTADNNPNTLKYLGENNVKYFAKPINIPEFKKYMETTFMLKL